MRAGTALTQLVEFADGFPDGNIDWELLDGTGGVLTAGNVAPEAASVSAVITITGPQNVIVEAGDPLFAHRELSWSYTVGGIGQSGRLRYRLEAFLPLGVSEEGVRGKLGVEDHELEDAKIDLVSAYSNFQATVGAAELAAVEGQAILVACDAIEALAALRILPTLQVSLANKESSGTNQFSRDKIDWKALRAHLENLLALGYAAVNPATDTTANLAPLLVVVVRDDPVTNSTP